MKDVGWGMVGVGRRRKEEGETMHGGRLPTAPKEGPSSGVLDLVETAGNRDGLEDAW